jgi:hypothetical protein
MSATDPALDSIETLQEEHARLCRLNGRLEIAAEFQHWLLQNKDRLPQWAVDDLTTMIVAALSAPTMTTKETRH